MAYSIERLKKIGKRVDEIGIYDTSVEFDISIESVKRAMRMLKQHTKEKGVIDEVKHHKLNGDHRVLCIGDLHAPFDLEEYYDFCCDIADKYKPTKVVFIGDVIDNHYASYHETDPDGLSGAEELFLSIERIKRWYNRFPEAYIIIGNHDRMVMRKAQTSNVPSYWIKTYKEVLNTPGWIFTERVDIDNVQYIHGEAGTARTKAKADMMSTVQGHLHTQAYTEWIVGRRFRIFAMQVGCGIDFSSYAMAYAKSGKKPAIGVGLITNGNIATNRMMEL